MNKWKVIEQSKKIESLLAKNYSATGKGLHSKLTSVERSLDASLVKEIRFIATIRNKLVHDESFNKIPKNYNKKCKEVIRGLSKKKSYKLQMFFIALILCVIVFLYYRYIF